MSQGAEAAAPTVGELPRLAESDRFRFACHPGVECFNACCRALDLQLNPYDLLRLRLRLGLSSNDFLERYVEVSFWPDTGFPAVRLRMKSEPAERCPFLEESGCSVYSDRPAACRIYPLGRGLRLTDGGRLAETWCLVEEAHCRGFAAGESWTPRSWLADQELGPYAAVDDRYLALSARFSRHARCLTANETALVALAAYQVDRFGEYLDRQGVLDGLGLPSEQREAISADERCRLEFALDWLGSQLEADHG